MEVTMDSIIYTIWLSSCLGAAYRRSKQVMETFESPRQIFEADEKELRLSGIFSNADISRLMRKKNIDLAKRVYERALQLGNRMIDAYSDQYPGCFRELSFPPFMIYIKGELPRHNGICAGIVGTRQATMVGRQTAFELSYDLTKNNVLVISGGAHGIDTQAHKGALQAGGKTICVLGCGTNAFYNMENSGLRREIAKHGALITEYAPDSMPAENSFPFRNRLIAALSDCCIVVEGGLGSGSLITAARAAELSKRIFAVPGSLDNPKSLGSNMLLTAGALAAVSYKDILKWYTGACKDVHAGFLNAGEVELIRCTQPWEVLGNPHDIPQEDPPEKKKRCFRAIRTMPRRSALYKQKKAAEDKPARISSKNEIEEKAPEIIEKINEKTLPQSLHKEKIDNNISDMLTTTAKSVYDTISGTPMDADTISRELGEEIRKVLSALTELELFGYIEPCGIGSYRRKER